jgi:hypothetical protein
MNELPTSSVNDIRKCSNIKSKKSPDIQCKLNAIHGDYCSKHWKHPNRFNVKTDTLITNKLTQRAALKIQRAWKQTAPYLTLFHQGPSIALRSLSNNTSEISSFEPIESIIKIYYFSFIDSQHNLWTFDIRSIAQMISLGTFNINPYTRQPIGQRILQKALHRISWLRSRKYTILYPSNNDITPEQLRRQKVLDVCMRLESFGFHISCEWFSEMTLEEHVEFYKFMYELWNFRLGLTYENQIAIVPSTITLFKTRYEKKHTHSWWERVNLNLIETLVKSSPNKEGRCLGATYCIMGFVKVNKDAAAAFPWLYESLF